MLSTFTLLLLQDWKCFYVRHNGLWTWISLGVEGYTSLSWPQHHWAFLSQAPSKQRKEMFSLIWLSWGICHRIQLLKCDGSSHYLLKYSFQLLLLSGQNLPRKWDFWSNFCLWLKKFSIKSPTLSQEYWLFRALSSQESKSEFVIFFSPQIRRNGFSSIWSISIFYTRSVRWVSIFHSNEVIVYTCLSSSAIELFIFVV